MDVPGRVDESGVRSTTDFSAPSAGLPPRAFFRIDAVQATALATVEPGGATRFNFDQ